MGQSTPTRWNSCNRDVAFDDPELIEANEDMAAHTPRESYRAKVLILVVDDLSKVALSSNDI